MQIFSQTVRKYIGTNFRSEYEECIKAKNDLRAGLVEFNDLLHKNAIFSPVYIEQKLSRFYNIRTKKIRHIAKSEEIIPCTESDLSVSSSNYVILTNSGYPTLGVYYTQELYIRHPNRSTIIQSLDPVSGLFDSSLSNRFYVKSHAVYLIDTSIPILWLVSSESTMDGILRENPEYEKTGILTSLIEFEQITPRYTTILEDWARVNELKKQYVVKKNTLIDILFNEFGDLECQIEVIRKEDVFFTSSRWPETIVLSFWTKYCSSTNTGVFG